MNFLKPGDLNFQQHCLETYGSIENLIDKAKNGEIIAQADLGWAYSEGFGDLLPKDNDKAIGWLNTSVERGYEIPSILGKLGELLDRKGTPLHQQRAYEMYHRASKLGCTTSQINLAEMYRRGVEGVVNEDLKESFKWLKRAAGEDLSDGEDLGVFGGLLAGTMKKVEYASRHKALRLLYQFYLEGNCPEGRPQPSKAVHYLTRAAEQGDTKAQLNLGQIYLAGNCEQVKDIGMARRWLGKASASGNERAKQLLQQCKQCVESQDNTSELSGEAVKQTAEIFEEKLMSQIYDTKHPLTLTQPVAFSEEMLGRFDWSPTARNYLQAFKLVKEGFAILYKSNFTDGRGVSLIAHGYLTENTILQAFPEKHLLMPKIFQLCERNLQSNSHFFEGLVLSYAFHRFELRISEESSKVDLQKAMCLLNMINLIQRAEPNMPSPASKNPFSFEENYRNWLHVLYWHLGVIFVVEKDHEKAAEAAENSLKCCPSYIESKRLLGFALMEMCGSKSCDEKEDSQPTVPTEWMSSKRITSGREISKYASWTAKKLTNTAMKVLKEFLVEAPPCHRFYPNVYYYLAQLAFDDDNMEEFKKYYELGQDAEEKRLPFFAPDDVPPNKVWLSTFYQLLPNIRKLGKTCGNKACMRKVKETELKSCAGCGMQKYCSKDCQRADWKKHKTACIAFRKL